MPLLTSLLILLVVARLLGQVALRFKQPEILGEMIAGVLLGPAVLGIIHYNPQLRGVAELAVFLVVLSAGLEMDFKDVVKSFQGGGLFLGLLGFIIPLAGGILVGIAFQLDVMRSVFIGLVMLITALPVAIRILQSFKLLRSEIGRYSVATAVLNDVAALLALGVILNLPAQKTFRGIAFSVFSTGGKLILLAAAILGFNSLLKQLQKKGIRIKAIPEKFVEVFGPEALFGIVISFVLVFASMSEILGFHFVIGAFFGGLLINKELFLASRYNELEKTLNSVTSGFLAPLFFATLGLEFSFSAITSFEFVAVVLLVSILTKFVAGWVGGRALGLTPGESMGIGIILNGRGAVGFVVASIAFERGFIGSGLFSILILMGLATTIMTPISFRKWALPLLAKEKA